MPTNLLTEPIIYLQNYSKKKWRRSEVLTSVEGKVVVWMEEE